MAKQTFTTGQVLTAAQMTSLQQTAMGGGSATTKTASYTLVAADAGTTVTMTSASATTITVNTSLFAAGDTVYIQNLGAGVSTITAGTATVNTSASLALAQYEGGQLYFNSTSAAIFIKGAGAAAASGSYTLLSTTSLSGTSTTVSSISQSYQDLFIEIYGVTNATNNIYPTFIMNTADSLRFSSLGTAYAASSGTGFNIYNGVNSWDRTSSSNYTSVLINDYATTDRFKSFSSYCGYTTEIPSLSSSVNLGVNTNNPAIAAITFSFNARTMLTGTIKIWGIK